MYKRFSIFFQTLLLMALLLIWVGDLYATEDKWVYSIQVLSSGNQDDVLDAAHQLEKIVSGVRVEKHNGEYVIRVGRYDHAAMGEPALRKIRKTYQNVFIRNAYYNPRRVIYGDRSEDGSNLESGSGRVASDVLEPLTLEQSLKIALSRNLMLQSAKEDVIGAEAEKKEAYTHFLPKVSTSYSYQRLNDPPKFKTASKELALPAPINTVTIPASSTTIGTMDNYVLALDVTQPIYAGGAIASNYQAQLAGEEIAKMEEQTTILDVTMDVKVSYYNVLKAEKRLTVARQSLEQLKTNQEKKKQLFVEGMVTRNIVLAADMELANGEQALLVAENSVALAKAKFNTILRWPIDADVELEDDLDDRPGEKQSLESCIADAMENLPEIRSCALKAEQAGKLVDTVRSEYYPSVNAVGHYELTGDTPGVQGSAYKDRSNWYVMAVASWNIWDWGKTKYRVDASQSRENKMNHALANIREQMALGVKIAWLSLHEAEMGIMASKKAIIEAGENFRIIRAKFKEHLGTAADVVDAETLLTHAYTNYYNALKDYQIGIARLDRAMGKQTPM